MPISGVDPASQLIAYKNTLLSHYNNLLVRDQYGQFRPKPGFETQYEQVVAQLRNIDQQIANTQATGLYTTPNVAYPPLTTMQQPPMQQTTSVFGAAAANAMRMANNQPQYQQTQTGYNAANTNYKQRPQQETPKEKIYVGGSLPYLEYLCDINHKANLSKRAGKENEYSFEVLVNSETMLEWNKSNEVESMLELDMDEGTVIGNGLRLINPKAISGIKSSIINAMFKSLIQTGRKTDNSSAQSVVTLNLKQQQVDGKQGNKMFQSLDKAYFYLIPLVVIAPTKDNTYYRVSRLSHNLLFNKLMTLSETYNLIMVGWYEAKYSSYIRYLAFKVDEEFGLVNTNLAKYINWAV